MIRYTTPTVALTVDAVIPEANVFVTFSQGAAVVTKPVVDITRGENNTSINVLLTQEETSRFKTSQPVSVQVNWITPSGVRIATDSAKLNILENLLSEVVEYDDQSIGGE